MLFRSLGKTGLEVSILGLGGARIGNLDDGKTARDVVRRCYDLGVTYFDAAAAGAYGLSQSRYGAALHDVRDKIVLATKTRHRTAPQAQLDLDQSLANFRTDRIDLYQVHNVMTDADIDECIEFVGKLSTTIPVALGIAPFCAKRNTPLDGAEFADRKSVV